MGLRLPPLLGEEIAIGSILLYSHGHGSTSWASRLGFEAHRVQSGVHELTLDVFGEYVCHVLSTENLAKLDGAGSNTILNPKVRDV